MITHPERDILLAHADRELADDEARAVEAHVAACAVCSRAVTSLEDDAEGFAALLSSLDALEPQDWVTRTSDAPDIAHVADAVGSSEPGATDVLPLRPGMNRRAAPARQATLRWAAGIFLTTAVAASAAVVVLDVWPATDTTSPPPTVTAAPAAVEEGVATVIATPVRGVLAITLSNAGAGARLHISVNDNVSPSVAVTGTDAPRFTAVAGRVDVLLGAGTSVVRVTVPRDLDRVEVTLDGAVVASVVQGSVSPAAAAIQGGIPLVIDDATTGESDP